MYTIKKSVYLDQNVLTELRIRKIKVNNPQFSQLLKILLLDNYTIVYSKISLTEIYNIENKVYILEHLELLKVLKAVYWNSIFMPKSHDIYEIYEDFVKVQENKSFKSIRNSAEAFIKRANGINTGLTSKESFNKMLTESISAPFLYISEKIPLIKKPNTYLSKKLTKVILSKLSYISDGLSDLNPLEFRDVIKTEEDIESIDPDVVMEVIIEQLCNYDPNFINLFNINTKDAQSIEAKIEFVFNFLNWIGYYPDKFQNDTNKKGFHAASMRDVSHAGTAWHFDYIISSDFKFRQKTKACYAFIGSKTKILSVEEFLALHHQP